MDFRGDPLVYSTLKRLNIPFEYHEPPEAPTVEIASIYWKGIEASHCKNLFFRNHKGNRHYLVILEYRKMLNIHQLEKILKQRELTFASPERLNLYLGLNPGSVSPFGLLHDTSHHVHLFIDNELKSAKRLSFHPNLNTASLVIATADFFRYLDWVGNGYEFIDYVNE